jgi:hypothetical protein
MQNEPKNQGCEVIDGGRGISATFYQWSTTVRACKLDFGRYDKRFPQIFQLPQSANYFKAVSLLRNKIIFFDHFLIPTTAFRNQRPDNVLADKSIVVCINHFVALL